MLALQSCRAMQGSARRDFKRSGRLRCVALVVRCVGQCAMSAPRLSAESDVDGDPMYIVHLVWKGKTGLWVAFGEISRSPKLQGSAAKRHIVSMSWRQEWSGERATSQLFNTPAELPSVHIDLWGGIDSSPTALAQIAKARRCARRGIAAAAGCCEGTGMVAER